MEIFSAKISEEGKKLIKEGKVNYDNVVSLTGSEYFDKMLYEF